MPWTAEDARRHTHKAKSAVSKRQWAHVADSVLQKTGDEGLAVREANGVLANRVRQRIRDKARRAWRAS